MKTHQRAKEKLFDLEAKLIGNRITTLGRLGLIAAGGMIFDDIINDRNIFLKLIYMVLSSSFTLLWGRIELQTAFGTPTYKAYKRTKKDIQKGKDIDFKIESYSRLLDKMSAKDLNGNCEWQGIYLAARATGRKKEFRELQRKYYHKPFPLF